MSTAKSRSINGNFTIKFSLYEEYFRAEIIIQINCVNVAVYVDVYVDVTRLLFILQAT